MSGILSTYFSTNSTYNNNLSIKKLENNEIMLKLPKISITPGIITEKNKSAEELFQDKIEGDIKYLYRISKLNSYRKKQFNKQNKKPASKIKITNNMFRNKILSELNSSTKASFDKHNNNHNHSLTSEPIRIKDNLNKTNKEKHFNYISINTNNNNLYNNTERNNTLKNKKNKIVNEYVSILINEDNSKKNEMYSLYNSEINENTMNKDKFSLEKSIDPTKYIKNKFLDESYNNNDFKTSKIQIDCFNGNEKLRNVNIQKINANNMNNFDLKSLKTESNDIKTQSLISQMFNSQQKSNNFYFGKKNSTPKFSKIRIKNTINIKNFLKNRRKERDNNIILTIDEKIQNALLDTKDMKNDLIERHKAREKIMNRIKQYCDNMDGIIKRESIIRRKKFNDIK